MWVREMLVSIVTVLSRLPSLAATMEAKFSAPAESKAMVNFFFFAPPFCASIPFTPFVHPSVVKCGFCSSVLICSFNTLHHLLSRSFNFSGTVSCLCVFFN